MLFIFQDVCKSVFDALHKDTGLYVYLNIQQNLRIKVLFYDIVNIVMSHLK